MKIRKHSATPALLAALLFSAALAFAQGAPDRSPGASAPPLPSRLRVAVKENLIILTWSDAKDFKGSYAVYRSDSVPSLDGFPAMTRLGEVASGAQTYTDAPPDSKPYFYAVLGLGPEGVPFQVFVPATNVTSIGIAAGKTAPRNPAAAAQAAPKPVASSPATASAPPQAFVSALAAKTKGDAIVLTYKASPKSRLVLYRGSTPIISAADLLDASLVAAFVDKDGSFADFPVPGVDYFYALLGEEDLKAGRISIAPGVNSLSLSVQVRASAVASGFAETPPSSRTPPLPYFLMEDRAFGSGVAPAPDEGPPLARPVSPDTEKAIAALLASSSLGKPKMPEARILPEEQGAPSGGEDYALSLIVSDRIASKDWTGAADQLRKYLSLNRGPKASARARFYLGEALAHTGSGRDAFFEFLSARELYPIETKPWIEYVLSTLPRY